MSKVGQTEWPNTAGSRLTPVLTFKKQYPKCIEIRTSFLWRYVDTGKLKS